MSDHTNEANYKEFVAIYAENAERMLGPVPGWLERIEKLHGSVDVFAAVSTKALGNGGATIGPVAEATCKRLGIKPTYKAISAHLTGTFKAPS